MTENNFEERSEDLRKNVDRLKQETSYSKMKEDGVTGERVFGEIVGAVIFGVVFGMLLDNYFHTKPIFLLTLLILGLAASVYNIYKATNSESNSENSDSEEKK